MHWGLAGRRGAQPTSQLNLAAKYGAEVKGAKYEWVGVCGKEVRTDGVFKGETTLTASNSKAEQVGAYLTGDEEQVGVTAAAPPSARNSLRRWR